MAASEFTLHLLQSAEQMQLLNDVDKLRSDGIQYHDIALPQLVVCGDQSSGKSSVLEALSNVKFPVDTSLCTRFAMELALRRSPESKATAKVIPGKAPLAGRPQRLADFRPPEVGLAGVPKLIEMAREAMGLGEDHAVCDDVLRLEISGPDLPHLTLVDLPGLIADAQDGEDIQPVEKMVTDYMENKRSIILAIVSAQNDKQNQRVLRLARRYDPHGDRTVGVITKPDLLKHYRGSGAERSYLNMAKNQDAISKLRLGWHVVRNPDYQEKREGSTFDREEVDREIFSKEPWNELSKWQLGIQSLRDELTKHLFNLICSELPHVVKDIEREEAKCDQELKDLGEVRVTTKEQRKYLIGISRRFEQLVGTAMEGRWTSDPIFNVEGMRLRAQIRNSNDAFERTMRHRGHTFEFIPAGRHKSQEPLPPFAFNDAPPIKDRAQLLRKADKVLKSGRGQELPGMFDPILVSDVFRDQSQKWQHLAREHVKKVWEITDHFLQSLLFQIAPAKTTTAEAILTGIVSREMLNRKRTLNGKIDELLLPYVKNLPFCTSSRMAASLKQLDWDDKHTEGNGSPNPNLGSLVADNEVDIDACSMLLRYSQAYYNIARDTFVDNVATLAIENCLLTGLASIFSSDMILDMEDGQLANLAGESEKSLSDRRYAEEKSRLLKKSLETCRIHMSKRPILREDSQRGLAQELASPSLNADNNPPDAGLFNAAVEPRKSPVPRKSRSPRGTTRGANPPLPHFELPRSSTGSNLVGGPASSALSAPAASDRLFPSGNTSFGSTIAPGPGVFTFASQSDTSTAAAQNVSLGSDSAALFPSSAVQSDLPGRRSPRPTEGASATARAATSSPTPPPSSSGTFHVSKV